MCSAGRPTVAVVTLLRQLGAEGATLYQHADFDPAGLAISAWLADGAATVPWRMTAEDYLTAAGRVGARPAMDGPVPATPWDPALAVAVDRERVPVCEEDVRETLLAAMRRG